MAQSTTLSVGDTFPVGSTVEAHPRLVDTLSGPPVTTAVASAKVNRNGDVTFAGLVPFGPYFATGEKVSVEPGRGEVRQFAQKQFTAAGELPAASERHSQANTAASIAAHSEAAQAVRDGQPSIAGSSGVPDQNATARQVVEQGRQVVTGARNSVNVRPGVTTGKEAGDPEPLPHPRQEDAGDQPQRSNTATGEAHPKDDGELQPKPDQASVKKGEAQRSQTPQGEATPVGEPPRQEDVSGPQRSQTATGEGTSKPGPKPKPRAKRPRPKAAAKKPAKGRATVKSSSRSAAGKSKVKG